MTSIVAVESAVWSLWKGEGASRGKNAKGSPQYFSSLEHRSQSPDQWHAPDKGVYAHCHCQNLRQIEQELPEATLVLVETEIA
jgi:hypothetical protein